MQDRPNAAEILDALAEYLGQHVLPNVDGTLLYHTRVALNLTQMLRREADLYPPTLVAERDRLEALTGMPAPVTESVEGQIRALSAELQRQLREDEDVDERAVWLALSKSCATKLAISRAGYDAYDMAVEAT